MVHKIQTSGNSFLSLEVKIYKSEPSLIMSKGETTLIFNQQQTSELNALVQAIDPATIALKEYGSIRKWTSTYKVSASAFRGIKSFQIREWLVSPTYSGFGKQGISLPTYKIKELQMHLSSIMQEFATTPSS